MTNPALDPAASPPIPGNDTLSRCIGGIIGGAIGLAAHWFAMQRGVDIAIAVAAGMALGIAQGSRGRNVAWAVATGIVAPVVVLLTIWWFRAFRADPSLLYFLANIPKMPARVFVNLGAAILVGAWFGFGRKRRR